MTLVPTTPASVLEGTPVFGGAEEIAALAVFTERSRRDTTRSAGEMQRACSALGGLSSETTERIASRLLGRVLPGVRALERTLFAASRALDTYAAAVERVHTAARALLSEVESSLAGIRAQAAEIERIAGMLGVPAAFAWELGAPARIPSSDLLAGAERDPETAAHLRSAYAWEWQRAASLWQTELARIESAAVRWRGLIAEREQAERLLVSRLACTDVGRLLVLAAETRGAGGTVSAVLAAGLVGARGGAEVSGGAALQLLRLLGGGLTPAEVARAWEVVAADERIDLPAVVRAYGCELAALEGLPFSVRDAAGRAALDSALDPARPEQLADAAARMGLVLDAAGFADFAEQLRAVRRGLADAELHVPDGDRVQLVTLAAHDGVVAAAISLGDLDAARTIGVFVPGMNSSVASMSEVFDAFEVIRDGEQPIAMVAWSGYRAPNTPEELVQSRADAGGARLAGFLGGIAEQRGAAPPERFVLLGHSYGTNVGARALQLSGAPVDAFVTIGSAGLSYGTTAASLGVAEIHATHAEGDGIAQTLGRHVHLRSRADGGGVYEARVDPRELAGARVFSSEHTSEGQRVTMHNLRTPISWGSGAQWLADRLDGVRAEDEIGYLDPRASTVPALRHILRGEGTEEVLR